MATFVKLCKHTRQQQRNKQFLEIIKADVCDKATLFLFVTFFFDSPIVKRINNETGTKSLVIFASLTAVGWGNVRSRRWTAVD